MGPERGWSGLLTSNSQNLVWHGGESDAGERLLLQSPSFWSNLSCPPGLAVGRSSPCPTLACSAPDWLFWPRP